MKFDRVLVPLDGSPLAEVAVSWATQLAGPDATLLLLRAAEALALPGVDQSPAQIQVVREAEDYLTALAARLRGEGVKNVETSVWYGPAPSVIVEAASRRKADLIVMSTHGRSGLGRLVMGSVAESVLRGTTTPILLVRAEGAPVEAPLGAGRARPAAETARA